MLLYDNADLFAEYVERYLKRNISNPFIEKNLNRLRDWFCTHTNPMMMRFVTIDVISNFARNCSYEPIHALTPVCSNKISAGAGLMGIFCGDYGITKEHYNSSQAAGEYILEVVKANGYQYDKNHLLIPSSAYKVFDSLLSILYESAKVHNTTFTENKILRTIQNGPTTKHLSPQDQYDHAGIILLPDRHTYTRSRCRTYPTFKEAVFQQINTLESNLKQISDDDVYAYGKMALTEYEAFYLRNVLSKPEEEKVRDTYKDVVNEFTQHKVTIFLEILSDQINVTA